MNVTSPRLLRYLDYEAVGSGLDLPNELVPAEHFAGSELCSHRFSFYGETFDLPADIDWEHNPGNPHWGHDLNRFGFLVLHTPEDEEQALVMERLIIDWIEKSGHVRNSRSPYSWQNLLNVGIRIENWWRFLSQRQAEGRCGFTAAEWRLVKHSVFRQLLILLRLIDQRGYESNFAPIGLRAALFVLFASPAMPFREKLIRIAWRGLERAAQHQILPDGVQQELSPHYHWVALELFASCRKMALQAGLSEYQSLDRTIVAMARFLDAMMLPDGGIIAFGDSDFDYGPRINQFLEDLNQQLPFNEAEPISIYPYAGLGIVRDKQAGHVLAFDAGPHGTAHQHEDALSFWLTAFGEHFIVDPGRYLYDYSPESMYTYLKSTAAHTTIMIGGQGQNAHTRPQTWRRREPAWPELTERDGRILLTGRYDGGYGDAYAGIRHERTIECNMDDAHWVVHDKLDGEGIVPVELRFQLAPSNWVLEGNRFVCRRGEARLTLEFGSEWQAAVYEGQMSPKSGWYSSGLNTIEPAPCLSLKAEMTLPVRFSTHIEVCPEPSARIAFDGQLSNVPANAESTSGGPFMSRKPRHKPVKTASGAASKAPVADAPSADQESGAAAEEKASDGKPLKDAFARMQEILSERIDTTRDKLLSNEAAFSRLLEHEATIARQEVDIARLEADIEKLRQSEKALQIKANQMSAENAVFRNRVEALQRVDAEVTTLRQVVERVNKVAGEELGRIVKALLPATKGTLLKQKLPVGEQAKLLVDRGVVDPEWYLKRNPDVADAGMEAAVHYVLHGADEGRQPGPAVERAAKED